MSIALTHTGILFHQTRYIERVDLMKRVGTKMYDKHCTGKESPEKDETKWIEIQGHIIQKSKFLFRTVLTSHKRKQHTVVDRTATT